jgi:hypothetical protein
MAENKSLIEYRRELPEQFNEAQLAFLQARTPQAFIKFREGRGGNFAYVEIGYIQLMLNTVFGNGGWDWEYSLIEALSYPKTNQIVVSGKLTARVHNQENGNIIATIVKTASGGGEIKCYKETKDPIDLADDLKSASADALKKAASYIGIAADVYAPKVFAVIEAQRKKRGEIKTNGSVIDIETEEQLNALPEEKEATEQEIKQQLLRRIFALADKIHKDAFDTSWIKMKDEERKEEIKEGLNNNGLKIESFSKASIEELRKAVELLS